MSYKTPVRFAASRWYSEPALQAIEDTEARKVKIVLGERYKTYNCYQTTQVYTSENKNVFLLWYPKLRHGVVIYSHGGVITDHEFYTKLPLKEANFCVNNLYLEDTAGNKQVITLNNTVNYTPSINHSFILT